MGTIDLPSFVEFVLKQTGHDKLSYVGHSQGVTNFLMGASLKPEFFGSKVNYAIMLSPVIRIDKMITLFNYPLFVAEEAIKLFDQFFGFANMQSTMKTLEK
jgi:pimeloyl-ACP methyl ester carboxylesterase